MELICLICMYAALHTRRICQVEKEFHLDSNNFHFVSAGENNVGGYKRYTRYNWSFSYKLTATTKNCPLADSFQRPMA